MTVLVTGAAGFIGSNYVRFLLGNHPDLQIVGLDKLTYAGSMNNLIQEETENVTFEDFKRFTFVRGDINDRETVDMLFEKHSITGVVNFAAETHVDRSIIYPRMFFKTNVLGTQCLLDACLSNWADGDAFKPGVYFLQVSTDEVYGSLGPTGAFTETTNLDPHSPYSASKAAADLAVKSYYDTYRLPILITRCSNNYGPRQYPEKLIPLMIRNALDHKDLPIYGDGKHVRDWLYVYDHCSAIDLVAMKGKHGSVYNIGGHSEHENLWVVNKLIETVNQMTGDEAVNTGLIKHVTDRMGHDRRYAMDSTKIQSELGWEPTVEFEQGIRKTVMWYLAKFNESWRLTV
jgi:dTDP-glucose 4,6-dehydratase